MAVFLFLILAAPDVDSSKPQHTRPTTEGITPVPPVPFERPTAEMTLFPESEEEHDDIRDKLVPPVPCRGEKPGFCPQ